MGQYAPVTLQCRFEIAPVPASSDRAKSTVWRGVSSPELVLYGRDA
jgi:hypothetical protein